MTYKIVPIKAFQDNYIWALCKNNTIWVVDPGDASPVFEFLQHQRLQGILVTHHHWDHIGGIEALVKKYHVPVYGPSFQKQLPTITGLHFNIIPLPGHTLDHIAYYNQQGILFCGDTLFAGGCGRVFEGTYTQMYTSLMTLAQLPDETRIYCAHEYTLQNLIFAQHVDPDNQAVVKRLQAVQALPQHAVTVPSTIGFEKITNPFLRCHTPAIQTAVSRYTGQTMTTPIQVFKRLRQWKNSF